MARQKIKKPEAKSRRSARNKRKERMAERFETRLEQDIESDIESIEEAVHSFNSKLAKLKTAARRNVAAVESEVEASWVRLKKAMIMKKKTKPGEGKRTASRRGGSLVCIKTFPIRKDAEIAQALLKLYNVESLVNAEDSGSMRPYLAIGSKARLMVNRRSSRKAMRILKQKAKRGLSSKKKSGAFR